MITDHLIHDTSTLKACAATCFSWYNVATPHLHHTLTLRQWSPETSHKRLNPLASLDKFGLLPLVRRVQFEKELFAVPWVIPATFDCQSMQYFGALENVQELAIADLDFSKFPIGLGEYFGRFSPTLRSVALSGPRGTHRQLLDFLRLFPELGDIKILHYQSRTEERKELDTQPIPTREGLRGRLTLVGFGDEELLKDIISAFGGMRLTFMDLQIWAGRNCFWRLAPTLWRRCVYVGMTYLNAVRGSRSPRGTFPTPGLTFIHQYSHNTSTSRATLPFDPLR